MLNCAIAVCYFYAKDMKLLVMEGRAEEKLIVNNDSMIVIIAVGAALTTKLD